MVNHQIQGLFTFVMMSDSEDTWENFYGEHTTADLLPLIMSTMDAMLIQNTNTSCPKSIDYSATVNGVGKSLFYVNDNEPDLDDDEDMRSANAKRQGTFTALSPNVQKLLSHLPDDDVIPQYPSQDNLLNGSVLNLTVNGVNASRHNLNCSRTSILNRSQRYNKSVDTFSPNVQKIIANLQNGELIINCNGNAIKQVNSLSVDIDTSAPKRPQRQRSVDILKQRETNIAGVPLCNKAQTQCHSVVNGNVKEDKQVCFEVDNVCTDNCSLNKSFSVPVASGGNGWTGENSPETPLGSYLHRSASGIASRTPVGRKNMGKYLQIPSGSTNSSTISSSEVSRPVSLTSLGSSCSSSGSSGMLHQQGSVYLASAESLDSDHEAANISQGSADSGIAESNTTSPELRVLREVLDTETVYVHDLKQVIEGYLEPWRNEPDCPIQNYLKPLFSNLEEIYAFNRSFLRQLKSAACDPTLTANAFLQNDSGFSVYTEYCTDYPRTMDALTAITMDEKMASLIRDRQRALGHDLPVGSYLLKPVQRILKYRLLLQRLSKHCLDQHRPTVDLALTTMTAVATHINTMKRKHEHAVRVQEVQSQLRGWDGADVTALGELIAEGSFRVNGARGRRHVFLFEKVLLMTKSRMDSQQGQQGYTYKAHIMCSNLMLVEQVRGEPLSFHILPFDNPRLQCTLRARSPQHKREWTLQLKKVIIENYSAVIPSHARQLVMQLGQDSDLDDSASTDHSSGRTSWSPLIKQHSHSPPQYLERKTRYRQSRNAFNNRRTSSHDRSFSSLTNWRRKSDPSGGTGAPLTSSGMLAAAAIAATLPNASKQQKDVVSKELGSQSKFYMDLSDEEEEDEDVEVGHETMNGEQNGCNGGSPETDSLTNEHNISEPRHHATMEQLVSDLLAHNEELQKKLSKPRRRKQLPSTSSTTSTLTPTTPIIDKEMNVWTKQQQQEQKDASDNHLHTKADSLPRSFLLNDQLDIAGRESAGSSVSGASERTLRSEGGGEELVDGGDARVIEDAEDIHETDISSQLDETDFPPEEQPTEHKIYRKSPIRHSLLQRFRAILSEHERFSSALSGSKRSVSNSVPNVVSPPLAAHKQGSRSMGAKLANPDYAVPSEILTTLYGAESTIAINTNDIPDYFEEHSTEDYRLDRSEMTINEDEVFEALNERLQLQQHQEGVDGTNNTSLLTDDSSHQREDYYEQILDEKLSEEDRRRGVDKSDSFRSENNETAEDTHVIAKPVMKKQVSRPRMLAPPPPIPVKPKFLSLRSQQTQQLSSEEKPCNGDNSIVIVKIVVEKDNNGKSPISSTKDSCNRGWVRTIVNRFE